MWEGPKLDLDFCLNALGIEQADHSSRITPFLSSFIKQNLVNGVQVWRDRGRECLLLDDVFAKAGGSIARGDLVPLIHKLRVIKSASEQELMRRSCSVIAKSAIETMKVLFNSTLNS